MTFSGPIGDLIEFSIGGGWGSDVAKSDYSEVAVIRGTDMPKVAMGDISNVPRRYESNKKLANRLLKSGDVILETAGGSSANGQFTGRTLLVTDEILQSLGPTICASFCKRLELKKAVIDPGYFYWYMQDLYNSGRVAVYDSQSTGISNFQFSSFLESEFLELPNLATQRAIADLLSSINSLIKSNFKSAQLFEEMAHGIFKSWFINFDPVKAKMAGEKPVGMDDATAALFPDSMEDSELGPIPKGWSKLSMGNFVQARRGKVITKSKTIEGPIPVIAGGLEPAYFHNIANVSWPAVTVSASGANAGFVRLNLEDIWASDCSFISKGETEFVYTCYLFLKVQQEIVFAMQQGGAQPHIYPSDLSRLTFPVPGDLRIFERFEQLVAVIFQKVRSLDNQTRTLTAVRDALLPRLISGELQIPEELLVS